MLKATEVLVDEEFCDTTVLWDYCRSPARAKRRVKNGKRSIDTVGRLVRPHCEVYQIADTDRVVLHIHPARWKLFGESLDSFNAAIEEDARRQLEEELNRSLGITDQDDFPHFLRRIQRNDFG